MSEKVLTQRCRNCKRKVIVTPGQLFDAEPTKILTPNADGLWELVEGHVEHRCADEVENG